MKKSMAIVHFLFLGVILLSALHYWDIGQWKDYVRLFGGVETLVVLTSIILFSIKRTRMKTFKYIYIILGVMQLFPMLGALGLVTSMPAYFIFHLIMVAWCTLCLAALSKFINVE